MRALLIALLFLAATSRAAEEAKLPPGLEISGKTGTAAPRAIAANAADDDLFTGVPPEKVPVDVRNFLSQLTNALNSGEANTVLFYAVTPESTGTGMFFLRQRLTGLSKERKVKKIEMLPSVAEADVEDLRYGVKYKPSSKPTHTVVARLEGVAGDVAVVELPVAKVANINANNEVWRIMTSTAAIAPGESARLAEAKALAASKPDVPRYLSDLAILHALLGQRKEAEAVKDKLLTLADGKAANQASYIHTQVGWIHHHLGDAKPALEAFKKGFELGAGKLTPAEIGLAVGYHATGDFTTAVRHYDHAAGQTPLYSDRTALEKYLKDTNSAQSQEILAVQNLWLRAFVPNPIPQP